MRILTVVHDFLPRHVAGAELMTYLLTRELARRGHEVHLLFAERDTGRAAYAPRVGTFDGLPFTEVAYDNVFRDYEEMYADPGMTAAFEEVLRAFRPELVHFQHTAFFGIDTFRVAHEHGVPIAATLHEYYLLCPVGTFLLEDGTICSGPSPEGCGHCMRAYPLEPRRYGCAPDDRRAAWPRALERRAAFVRDRGRHVAWWISPSEFLVERFAAHGEPFRGRISCIRNGIPALAAAPPEPVRAADEVVFGYAGTLAEYKGARTLLEAFRRLRSPRARLEVWGELSWFPDFVAELRAIAGDDERITFHGAFDPRGSHAVYARFDVLVVPSRWYENAPVSIQEARRAGLPVVATDLGGMREAVRDEVEGLLFPRDDVGALGRALERLAQDDGLRARMSAAIPPVRTDVEMGRDYEALFRRLVAGV